MNQKLNIALFSHSLVSDWNHGNAHFLRGLMRELARAGHAVSCYEEKNSWSYRNLLQERGQTARGVIDGFTSTFPELRLHFYEAGETLPAFLERALKGVDLVLLHEWNAPWVVNSVLALKKKRGFIALLHDSHHRAYTQSQEIVKFNLHLVDGVLAFGEAIRRIYAEGFGVARTWTFHEAADVGIFKPLKSSTKLDVIWIGNWGDEERTSELKEFLIQPVASTANCRAAMYGVRYPPFALEQLQAAGIAYCGYIPNLAAPRAYSESLMTIHVPRRQYSNGLSGIPTIRVFEAMACGIPLLCSPWVDEEHLFSPGNDFLVAQNGAHMRAALQELLRDGLFRRQIGEHAVNTIRRRHTCAHRAAQLLEIYGEITR